MHRLLICNILFPNSWIWWWAVYSLLMNIENWTCRLYTVALYQILLITSKINRLLVTGPAKIGHVGTQILTGFVHVYAMAMKFSKFVCNLSGFIIQVTEIKCCNPYNPLRDTVYLVSTCPILQTQSHFNSAEYGRAPTIK